MDETTKTQQDNPPVETPEGDKGTTPEKEPETLEEQVAHIKETAFAEVGRYRVATEKAAKAAETAKKAADAAEVRLNKFIRESEEAELEAARDDSDRLTSIRARQRTREQEAELAKVRQELSDKEEELTQITAREAESTKEQTAREIASRLNVDPKLLAKLAKLTDGSTEAIEAEAQGLPNLGEPKSPLKPDSSKTIGGGTGLTIEKYKGMSSEQRAALDPAEVAKLPLGIG